MVIYGRKDFVGNLIIQNHLNFAKLLEKSWKFSIIVKAFSKV